MTAWRMPALVASAKNASKNRVRAAIASGICCSFQVASSVVDLGDVQFAGGPAGQEIHADGADQRLGVLVVDQGVVGLGGDRLGPRPPLSRWLQRWWRGPRCRCRCAACVLL